MSFANPLFLLLFLPLSAYAVYYARFSEPKDTLLFSSGMLVSELPQTFKTRLRRISPWLRLLGLAFLIIALARPQTGYSTFLNESEGVDIVIAIDTSGSMKALDFKVDNEPVNRLSVIKSVVKEFIGKRPFDRIGLVVFGNDAYTQSPLTLDHNLLQQFLASLSIGMAGENTAIGNAIARSVKRLKDLKGTSKIIILLTDGENTAGQIKPKQAAKLAREFGIKVYTIGVGTAGQVPVPVQTPFGTSYIYRQFPLDEKGLTAIAETTGGRYYRATDVKSLETIYNEIDTLEKSIVKVKEYHNNTDHFHPFLSVSVLLILSEILLTSLYLKRI